MPMKIFELAKELNKGALDLVEELKNKGFSVRNHMTVLSDEEVKQVMAEYNSAEEEKKASSSKTKKKVVKKKTTKKKVVKKAAAAKADSSEEPASEETETKKKTVVRRKSVIRKKSSGDSEPKEVKPAVVEVKEETPEPKVEEKVETPVEEVAASAPEVEEKKPEEKSDSGFGLRVVSTEHVKTKEEIEKEKAEAKAKKEAAEKAKQEAADAPHRFTPVYIPPEKKGEEGSSESSDDKKVSKGRMGALASMMSGKKNVNKSQALTQERADTELKSYALGGTIGRPVYSTVKRKKTYSGPTKDTEITEVKESKRVVKLHDGATSDQLAKKLKVKLKDMIDKCLDINLLIKSGDYIGIQLANEIAALYDYRAENVAFDEDKVIGKEQLSDEDKSKLPLRNPIIAIMGHVDHGKTTLLDHIRNAKVVNEEAGGITQHIGAYSVKAGKSTLTFLDTPGHAAFASMRQRGADVTDLVVLVVAADDGVMPQTRESVKYCNNAGVPIIVAVNKMDKEGINPDRIKSELADIGITPEEWGGDTQFVPISALKGDGVDDLLESIALQTEMLELRASDKGNVEGVVIESKIEHGRGPVATILVQSGTLKKGDSLVVGETFGRARSLTDHLGKQLSKAGPSTPVQILGLDEAPSPGASVDVVKNEREAKKIVANRVAERKKLEETPKAKVSLEDFFAMAADDGKETKELNLIVRSDVQGSFEAIKQAVLALSNSEVEVRVIAGGVGAINDNDVNLADSSGAFILGFNMRPNTTARRLAEEKSIDIKTYSIIYELINDVTLAIEGMLDPDTVEEFIGRAEVKDTFVVPKIGTIAGSSVIDGKIKVGCNIRLLRNGKIMFDGKMSSLKRFKDDVKEVKNGFECGIGLEGYTDIKVNDQFEAYMLVEKKRTLDDVAKEEKLAAEAAELAALEAEEASMEARD
ncbi:translation initiation factor IF-2 [Halobacteriovorax marinus SJ]|uniref:Translation initiation factor IF-2 n=2 Tax=Halobacteriovorax marinus TaxID=97084 RepID=E1X220_HALMS|nr:translation initiation factor IF-2 [Halobacteriovorax marinus SJ]